MDLAAPILEPLARSDQTARLAAAAAKGAKAATSQELRVAAEEFEAIFLSQMLSPIFDSLETDGLFGGGPGEKAYRSMLVDEYGKAISRTGGVGIADAVHRELLQLQEVTQ